MPKKWQNERSRRLWLQVTLWTVFVASIGVAAVVGHVRSRALAIKLGEVRQVGPVKLQVPVGWKTEDESSNTLELREGGDDEAFERHLEIRVDRGSLVDILALLVRGNQGETGKNLVTEAIKIGAFSGKFKVQQFSLRGHGIDRYFGYDVIASAPIGNGQTLSITMAFIGDPKDLSEPKDVVKRMAASVSLAKQEEPSTQTTTAPAP